MRTVQEIFNIMIETELYSERLYPLMCHALDTAIHEISEEEFQIAHSAIQEYIKPYGSLGGLLRHNNHAYEFKDKIEIYKNWDNRPIFSKTKAS